MLTALSHQFILPNDKQWLHLQFTQLVKGSMTMEEYTSKFYSFATRSEFPWNEDAMISMHYQGLTPQIYTSISTLSDAVKVVLQ